MPKEWVAACENANLFYEPPAVTPTPNIWMPEVGNGQVAWKVGSQTLFAAGLFNGPAGSTAEGDGNGRARIPLYLVAAAAAAPGDFTPAGRALDVGRAVFLTRRTAAGGEVTVEDRYYAPLQAPELLVHEIVVTNRGSTVYTVQLTSGAASTECDASCRLLSSSSQPPQQAQSGTGDLILHPVAGVPRNVYAVAGTNTVPETEAFGLTAIALAASIPPG